MAEPLSRSPLASFLPGGSTAGGLAFADLTLAPRAGIKGPSARSWLEGAGYGSLPPPNFALRRGAGLLLLAMLGESEALLLDRTGGTPLWSFGSGAALAPGAYPVPRAEGAFWITVAGGRAPDMFATVCAIDLRPKSFKDLQVAQTMIAKSSAIIIRDDGAGESAFHVLGDISLGPYLVQQLLAAAQMA